MPTQPPGSIDHALTRTRVFQGDYTPAHLEASRARLARDLTELTWMGLLMADQGRGARRRTPTALHEQAAHRLWELSQNVITDSEAACRLARFHADRDPGGALTFACLLDLADREEGAQFWWLFAAGAGNPTSALCLYFLHLRRGELRDADFWASQLAVLDREVGQYTPVGHSAITPGAPGAGITMRFEAPGDDTYVPDDAVKNAVRYLAVEGDDELGNIPQPSAALAHRLEDLLTR
ncbi:hypothetical protein [Streptomyces sp. cg36]|uniref:hypothetical protein n=1 Tax=Streptomyces sp. cg36 TaxID=3238798 RepID=UPI0034E226F6